MMGADGGCETIDCVYGETGVWYRSIYVHAYTYVYTCTCSLALS